eukprot:33715-Pyramimonas_sp.AAC.1
MVRGAGDYTFGQASLSLRSFGNTSASSPGPPSPRCPGRGRLGGQNCLPRLAGHLQNTGGSTCQVSPS